MKFSPCTGKCTDEGTHCEGCGRTHEEIAAMRKPVESLVALAEKMKYENTDDFANAVLEKPPKDSTTPNPTQYPAARGSMEPQQDKAAHKKGPVLKPSLWKFLAQLF